MSCELEKERKGQREAVIYQSSERPQCVPVLSEFPLEGEGRGPSYVTEPSEQPRGALRPGEAGPFGSLASLWIRFYAITPLHPVVLDPPGVSHCQLQHLVIS